MGGRSGPGGVVGEVVARAADPAYERWAEQVAHAGYCLRPVRLAGRVEAADTGTGALRPVYATDDEPDGTVLKACGQRRESVCPSCSAVYRADAWQLIAAGLRGGKGVPESVAGHPRLFVTLTAPSFGPVHSRRERDGRVQACAPRRGLCGHGQPRGCWLRHRDGDPALGQAICGECFDYAGAVLWNAHAPVLWARTTVYVRRALARAAGISRADLARRVRIAYVKVAEFQGRGLVHFHAVARLDGTDPHGGYVAPPEPFTAGLLAAAIREAVERVVVPYPGEGGARWGAQVDIREIANSEDAEINPGAVAAYIAKYATKSASALGMLDRPLTGDDVDRLRVSEHIRALVETCWSLAARPEYKHLHLRRWAHMLGFGGHWGTKSRTYSTSFAALRAARAAWAANTRDHADEAGDAAAVESWRAVGIGYKTPGDAWLAETAARERAEARALARAERARTVGGRPGQEQTVTTEPPTAFRPVNGKSSAAKATEEKDGANSAGSIDLVLGGDDNG